MLNDISGTIIDAAVKVHSALGQGLLEEAHKVCLTHELRSRNVTVLTEVGMPVVYNGAHLDAGYRLDLLVENSVIVELKSVFELLTAPRGRLCALCGLCGEKTVTCRDTVRETENIGI